MSCKQNVIVLLKIQPISWIFFWKKHNKDFKNNAFVVYPYMVYCDIMNFNGIQGGISMRKKIQAKNRIYLIAAILLVVTFSGCSTKSVETDKEVLTVQKKATFTNITPEEAKKRLDSEKSIILLDVRTKEEYETGHIKHSILMPVDTLKEESVKKLANKEAIIFVYCRSGNRSFTAANILTEQGYNNVYNLGGISNWPYEVVK